MTALHAWRLPWALFDRPAEITGQGDGPLAMGPTATWLYMDDPSGPWVDGRGGVCEKFGQGTLPANFHLYAMPIPIRSGIVTIGTPGGEALRLSTATLPERPHKNQLPATEDQQKAKALFDRVKAVWARLRDVETVVADPATMWAQLTRLWLSENETPDPVMDVIVRQAKVMRSTIELLDRQPRRILRRTRRPIPISRVQEVDQRTILWLVRQPGETIAERAGDRQRILAVAREENFNTLENRVLLSYALLARNVARDYRERHKAQSGSPRVMRVERFGRSCAAVADRLGASGVLPASADVTPNYVLQSNPNYRNVWMAWHELLDRERVLDELWRWQARSWEEFCALAVVVALQSAGDVRLIAVSPIWYLDEQARGCWIKHVNPLAVMYLPTQDVTIEISYRPANTPRLAAFVAPIWLRLGRIDSGNFLSRWAVWPVWHSEGGLEPGEPGRIVNFLPHGRNENLRGGITIRPCRANADAEAEIERNAASFTVGATGKALGDGLRMLGQFLHEQVAKQVGS